MSCEAHRLGPVGVIKAMGVTNAHIERADTWWRSLWRLVPAALALHVHRVQVAIQLVSARRRASPLQATKRMTLVRVSGGRTYIGVICQIVGL